MSQNASQQPRKIRSLLPSRWLAVLCHYANADAAGNRTFYSLKDRLLRQYAKFAGTEIQEITKECWGDRRDGYGDWCGCGPNCRRCGGSGVYDRRWIRLLKYQWGKYSFHIPLDETRVGSEAVHIKGRIQHPDYGRASREAEMWLYIATFQFSSWWKRMRSGYYCKTGLWPMCSLQKWMTKIGMLINRRRCWCGRMFWTFGTGWQVCRTCRGTDPYDDSDVPF